MAKHFLQYTAQEIDDLLDSNQYEMAELQNQEIIGYKSITTGNIYNNFVNTTTGKRWTGNMLGTLDHTEWPFIVKVDSDNYLKGSTNDTETGYIIAHRKTSMSTGGSASSLNEQSTMTEYDSARYVTFNWKEALQIFYLQWDFLRPCTPTLQYRVSTSALDGAVLQGSNDNDEWIDLTNITSSSNKSYTSTTPYRYYRIYITGNDSTSTTHYFRIFYLYWQKATYELPRYQNNFTIDHDFTKIQCKNVIIPSYDNIEDVVQSSINGIIISKALQQNERYRLRYNGSMLEFNDNPKFIVGSYLGASITKGDKQDINLGFKPTAVVAYYNSFYCFASADGYAGQSSGASNAVTSASTANGYIALTDNGFQACNGTDKVSSFNYKNSKYLYIAFQ